MLKQMRWRFIGAAMAAFTAVVLTLLCFVNLWNYHSMTDQQDEALAHLLEVEDQQKPFSREKDAPPFDDWAHFSPEVQYSLRFFSVHYDADGTVLRVDQDHVASLSEEDAKAYADAALAHQKAQGYESGYRYLVHTTDQETVVLFLNSERELQRMHSLLWITLVIAGVCLVVVFALVVLLSRRAILPYLKNMEAQKQFITNASHELKTPLTVILSSTELLEQGAAPEQRQYVDNIRAESRRMKQLVEDADILTPNLTEACILTDTPYHDGHWSIQDIAAMAEKLQEKGPEKVVVTGISQGAFVANVVCTRSECPKVIRSHRVGSERSGTGDVFAAVIAADAVNGVTFEESVRKAGTFVKRCILRSEELQIPKTDGVCFEELLTTLR